VFFDFNRDGLLDLFVCNVGVYTNDKKARMALITPLMTRSLAFYNPNGSKRAFFIKISAA
jgi:poly(A) polymerase Pap1